MAFYKEDFWPNGHPLERENFTVMTFRDPPPKLLEDVLMVILRPEPAPPPKFKFQWWLPLQLLVSCSMWAGILWVLGRLL